jgi:hypothetical protein
MDIVARAKGMILNPREEWATVAGESTDTRSLLLGYAAPLAAIPAVAGLVVTLALLDGRGIAGVLFSSLVGYVLGLVGVYIVAKIVETLAPRFGGTADEPTAMKLVVYAATASWVFGAAVIVPLIGWIVALIGALYSLYLFYLGTAPVARVPEGQAVVFTVAVVVVAIVVNILIAIVVGVFL